MIRFLCDPDFIGIDLAKYPDSQPGPRKGMSVYKQWIDT